jgi:hypothetical protein
MWISDKMAHTGETLSPKSTDVIYITQTNNVVQGL